MPVSLKTLSPALAGAPSWGEAGWAAATPDGAGSDDCTQISEFTFATSVIPEGQAPYPAVELALMAEPKIAKGRGLIFQMRFMCQWFGEGDNSLEIFDFKLNPAQCQEAAAAPNPIAYCLHALPKSQARLAKRAPLAMARMSAMAEAHALGASAPSARRSSARGCSRAISL